MKTFDLTTLQTNARNPQITTPERLERLRQSLADLPKMMRLRPLVYDPDTMTVLGGNKRLTQLLALGYTTVPAEWVASAHDFTPEERRRFIIADNVGFGTWDGEILTEDYTEEELEAWGLQPDDWADDPEEAEAPAATDDGYAPPPDLPTDIVPGDLITIGHHRLLCGDSTNADNVAKLMNGAKADMVFTDPPYGVSIVGTKNKKNIAGDLTQTIIPFSFDLAATVATKEDARFYFCGAESNILMYQKLFDKYLSQLPRHLIWVKNGFVMKPNGYHNQYEMIFHGYKPKGGGLDHWFGGRTEYEASDVWRINRDNGNDYLHPTQKPVELPSRAITNSCPPEGLVYEPFLGSGSTIVAAHQLNRRCYGLEIDPKYCQIIIDRMHKLDPTLPITINGTPYTPGE